MINQMLLAKAKELKTAVDAAHLVFKKNPNVRNSTNWSLATRAYNEYCVQIVDELIADPKPAAEDILKNFEAYKTCKQCNCELLYPTSDTEYIASSDFLPEFPGWCYTCLVEHCCETDCEACDVNTFTDCSFKPVKEICLKEVD